MSVLRGFVLMTACLVLGLPVASRADDPPADRQAAKPDGPDATSKESAAIAAPPSKPKDEAPAAPAAATKTTKMHLDTYDPDVPADTQANRLQSMQGIIELHMTAGDRQKFEAAANNYTSGDELEKFYRYVCSEKKLSCAKPK